MIKYQLQCARSHAFEGWFRNSTDYQEQADEGLLACPVCGSDAVPKAIMAPAGARQRTAPISARDGKPLVPPRRPARSIMVKPKTAASMAKPAAMRSRNLPKKALRSARYYQPAKSLKASPARPKWSKKTPRVN